MAVYERSAEYYDLLYRWKDYPAEVEALRRLIGAHGRPLSGSLLDVACGSGKHLDELQPYYTCAGLDMSEGLLEVARARLPEVEFYAGDMRAFDLGRQFDVVTCLFSAIGYMQTLDDLRRAIVGMARHVAPGGALAIEPWFHPGQFFDGYVHLLTIDEPDIKITRMSRSQVVGRLSIMDMHHLVGTSAGVEHFVECHEMGLFTPDEYLEAVAAAGLTPAYDADGLNGTGRGLVLGLRAG